MWVKTKLVSIILVCLVGLISGCGEKRTGTGKPDLPERGLVLVTSDDVVIHGTFFFKDDGEKHPAVILCHMYRSDSGAYTEFQELLLEAGIASLAIDFRGFGESVYYGLSYKEFDDSDYIDMLKDIEAAYEFLTSGPRSENVDADRIGIVGASIGANLAIMAGASIPELKCIMALSPSIFWHGLKPLAYAADVRVPLSVVYSRDDKPSVEVVPYLHDLMNGLVSEVISPGNAHGTDMLNIDLSRKLIEWISENFADEENVETDDR